MAIEAQPTVTFPDHPAPHRYAGAAVRSLDPQTVVGTRRRRAICLSVKHRSPCEPQAVQQQGDIEQPALGHPASGAGVRADAERHEGSGRTVLGAFGGEPGRIEDLRFGEQLRQSVRDGRAMITGVPALSR